jgi:hypothetical protein
MRPADLRSFVDMVVTVTSRHGLEPLITFTSLSDRLFDSTVPLVFDRSNPAAVAAAQACYMELLSTGRANGWFPYRISIDAMSTLANLLEHSDSFHQRLRQGLDPNDLMAPGRYR